MGPKRVKKQRKVKVEKKEIIKGYNPKTGSWHCTVCGEDMGECNPRQFCKKTYCPMQ